jgi:hypothetical protein
MNNYRDVISPYIISQVVSNELSNTLISNSYLKTTTIANIPLYIIKWNNKDTPAIDK